MLIQTDPRIGDTFTLPARNGAINTRIAAVLGVLAVVAVGGTVGVMKYGPNLRQPEDTPERLLERRDTLDKQILDMHAKLKSEAETMVELTRNQFRLLQKKGDLVQNLTVSEDDKKVWEAVKKLLDGKGDVILDELSQQAKDGIDNFKLWERRRDQISDLSAAGLALLAKYPAPDARHEGRIVDAKEAAEGF